MLRDNGALSVVKDIPYVNQCEVSHFTLSLHQWPVHFPDFCNIYKVSCWNRFLESSLSNLQESVLPWLEIITWQSCNLGLGHWSLGMFIYIFVIQWDYKPLTICSELNTSYRCCVKVNPTPFWIEAGFLNFPLPEFDRATHAGNKRSAMVDRSSVSLDPMEILLIFYMHWL